MTEGASGGGRSPEGDTSSSSTGSSSGGVCRKSRDHPSSSSSSKSSSRRRHQQNPSVPRSHSYSGRSGTSMFIFKMSIKRKEKNNYLSLKKFQPKMTGMEGAINGASGFGNRAEAGPSSGRTVNRHRPINDMDMVSVCSTCSSSSSDEEEDYSSYRLPAARRAAYGGVRISYVPNDAMALASARQRSQTLQSSSAGHSSRNASNGGGEKEKDKNCIIS